jgi:hypothetical protein
VLLRSNTLVNPAGTYLSEIHLISDGSKALLFDVSASMCAGSPRERKIAYAAPHTAEIQCLFALQRTDAESHEQTCSPSRRDSCGALLGDDKSRTQLMWTALCRVNNLPTLLFTSAGNTSNCDE